MPNFRRVVIQAIVETPAMLLPDDQVERALTELREKLRPLDLTIVSLASSEPPPSRTPEHTDADPWSYRGQPLN